MKLPVEIIAIILAYAGNNNCPLNKHYIENYHIITLSYSKNKQGLFYKACFAGKLKYVKLLLQYSEVDATADMNLAFRYSCEYGRYNVVKYLATIPDVNPGDCDGLALRGAVYTGRLDIVKFLCTLDRVNPHNEDLTKLAIQFNRYEVANYLDKFIYNR